MRLSFFVLALCASQTAIGVELTPTATIAAKGTLPRSTHAVSHTTETTRPLVLRGGASTEEKTIKFALINVALYAALFRGMTKFGGIRFVTFACWAVWGLWMASSSAFKVMMDQVLANRATARRRSGKFFKRFQGLMERTFLAPPGGWRRLRLQPFALFGSVFSHMSIDHISSNLGALQMCHEAEEWLGTAKFAHLYLTSGLIASVFRCSWQQYDLRADSAPSLGASGAISGVMAWWCIECFKRGKEFVFNDHRVSPLVFWAAYVAIDLSGMLRLGAAQKVLYKLVGHTRKDEPRGEVGYDAHIGGAIAGLLWQMPSLLLRVTALLGPLLPLAVTLWLVALTVVSCLLLRLSLRWDRENRLLFRI
jgi:membrane associated rhomboid family serine protease